ncbi:hypothetical protein SUGI_0036830 [Cryptomeria japonica]|uniref:phragmoplastin interacting protein 1 n=1 Tax=Cryptomeria japonica TaxID=3369 RepID=UPI0024089F31|nr:phragmoplastin interacting protein 1 [Cryptomeria japonica]GLJ06344.1 hypothetical protein SUGI_0036830 [Cryptomeria japonica]
MVLSNKKLKEKLRGALAEAALSKSRQNEDPNSSLVYLEELKRSSRKGPSKREKRRHRKELLHEEENQGAQTSKVQASQDNDSNGKKKNKGKNKGTSIEDNSAVVEDRDTQKRNKEKQRGNNSTHLETKDSSLQSGGSDKSKSNKKKKRKRGEDKDAQLEQNGKSDENREIQRTSHGDHLKNGHVEESKSSKKKKKKQKHNQDIQSDPGPDDKLASVVEEPPEDIIINAQEVTVTESQESEYDTLKVYVGGIPYYSNEDDIRSFFEGCGTMTEVDCMTFPDSGKFCGIALISFKTEAAAKRALALDGSDMGGRFLKIRQYETVKSSKNDKHSAFEPTKVDNSNRAYIGNLSWDITEDDVKNLFEDCEISAIRFGMDKTTGEFKGYGHVDFADDVSLAMALKLDQEVVCGRPIRISYAVPKRDSKPDGNAKSTSEKKKRRTCHNCGEPGHLSSSCPQKQSTEIVDANGDS